MSSNIRSIAKYATHTFSNFSILIIVFVLFSLHASVGRIEITTI